MSHAPSSNTILSNLCQCCSVRVMYVHFRLHFSLLSSPSLCTTIAPFLFPIFLYYFIVFFIHILIRLSIFFFLAAFSRFLTLSPSSYFLGHFHSEHLRLVSSPVPCVLTSPHFFLLFLFFCFEFLFSHLFSSSMASSAPTSKTLIDSLPALSLNCHSPFLLSPLHSIFTACVTSPPLPLRPSLLIIIQHTTSHFTLNELQNFTPPLKKLFSLLPCQRRPFFATSCDVFRLLIQRK